MEKTGGRRWVEMSRKQVEFISVLQGNKKNQSDKFYIKPDKS